MSGARRCDCWPSFWSHGRSLPLAWWWIGRPTVVSILTVTLSRPLMTREEFAKTPFSARAAVRSGVLDDRGDHCDRDIGHERHGYESRPLAIDTGITASRAAMLVSVFAGCSFIAKLNFAALADLVGTACADVHFPDRPRRRNGVSDASSDGIWNDRAGCRAHWLIRRSHGADGKLSRASCVRTAGGRACDGAAHGPTLLALLSTPPLFGLIFDLTGSYNGIFWTFCALALVALFWLPAIRLHPREAPPAEPVPAPVSVK